MHCPLCVERATRRARPAADDAARVAGDRPVRCAERLGAPTAQLGVRSRVGGVDWLDRKIALERLVLAVELGRPRDPESVAPAPEHPGRRAEAGPRVDHGRASDAASHGQRDRGPALAGRQAAVAVQGGERLDRIARVGDRVVVVALLEHDHVEPGLGEHASGRGAAGAGADDDHVAVLDLSDRRLHRCSVEVRGQQRGVRPATELAPRAGAHQRLDLVAARIREAADRLQQQHEAPAEHRAARLESLDDLGSPLDRQPREAPWVRRAL